MFNIIKTYLVYLVIRTREARIAYLEAMVDYREDTLDFLLDHIEIQEEKLLALDAELRELGA